MAKLYYGNGNCSIEGSNLSAIIIKYRGAIEIDDKTSDSFFIMANKDTITIAPIIYTARGTLNDLFDYEGELKIISVAVANIGAREVPTTIHRAMDYTELLNTNAEDMTTKSEDLSSTHISGKKVAKTTLKQPIINNLHTSKLYLEDGTLYKGYFHAHMQDRSCMTGREHTETSQDLYFKSGEPTRLPASGHRPISKRNRRIKEGRLKRERDKIRNRRKR